MMKYTLHFKQARKDHSTGSPRAAWTRLQRGVAVSPSLRPSNPRVPYSSMWGARGRGDWLLGDRRRGQGSGSKGWGPGKLLHHQQTGLPQGQMVRDLIVLEENILGTFYQLTVLSF